MPKAVAAIALATVCFLLSGSGKAADAKGRLTGKVVDDANENPVPGATVLATEIGGKIVVTKISEKDGSFKMENLPAQTKFNVTYSKQGYISDQHDIVVTAEQNGRLVDLNGTSGYYQKLGESINANLKNLSGPQRDQAWAAEWSRIASAPIPPTAKGTIARSLLSRAPDSLDGIYLFHAYAKADPKTLNKLDVLNPALGQPSDVLVNTYHIDSAIVDNIKASQSTN
jgi:hypothetical protein